jgi:hypothetical protein
LAASVFESGLGRDRAAVAESRRCDCDVFDRFVPNERPIVASGHLAGRRDLIADSYIAHT